MSRVIRRTQCPKCLDTGMDNLCVYEDGGEYCFACQFTNQSVGTNNTDTYERRDPPQLVKSGKATRIKHRALEEATCNKYGYLVAKYLGKLGRLELDGDTIHIANYCDDFGASIFQKIRAKDKQFTILGTSVKSALFGKHLFSPNPKLPIIVTEGEIDAMSVYQATQLPSVSIPNGAQSAVESLRHNIEWLAAFKEVVIGFDNDEAGQAAAKECVSLFEPGRVKVVNWDLKDANEMLVAGKIEEIKKCLWNAVAYRQDGIVSIDDILEKTLVKPEYGLSWPWESLTKLTYGIQHNSVYTIGAGSGQGKTEFMKDVMLHLALDHKVRVGAMFLEQKPEQTLLRLVGGLLGKRLHVPGDDWNAEEITTAAKKLKENIYLYDHFGGQDLTRVLEKIRYFVKGLGCKYIFLDHLTALAAEMSDERKGIDSAMAKLGSLVHELDFTLFLVSHLAKPTVGKDTRSYEEGRPVTASSFRGSQSIQYWSTMMFGIERNKLAETEQERMITTVRVLKDRFSGEADGAKFWLTYDRSKGQLIEIDEVI